MPPNRRLHADLVQGTSVAHSLQSHLKQRQPPDARLKQSQEEPSYWDWEPDSELIHLQQKERAFLLLSTDHIISHLQKVGEVDAQIGTTTYSSSNISHSYWYMPGSEEDYARELTSAARIQEGISVVDEKSTKMIVNDSTGTAEEQGYWNEHCGSSCKILNQERIRILLSAEHIQGNLTQFEPTPSFVGRLVAAHDNYWAE